MRDVRRPVPGTDLQVSPLCLGCNVFGWTLEEPEAFVLLDAYAAAGGNFLDTADSYTAWVAGRSGGESETMIGNWMASRGHRDEIVLATKVGKLRGFEGLSAANIRRAVEASLSRLRTDRIDLYYAHEDDRETPLEETLGTFDELVREGKVRHLGASNFTAGRLAESLAASDAGGMTRYAAVEPHYNLVFREYEDDLAELCAREQIGCMPYFALANGFLTGKYRAGAEVVLGPRTDRAVAHLDAGGEAILAALDEVAAAHAAPVAAVALAWLAAQPTVVSPIASARTPEQLEQLMAMADVDLSEAQLALLGSTGRPN